MSVTAPQRPQPQTTAEEPIDTWADGKLVKYAASQLAASEHADAEARKAGNQSIAAYLLGGRAYRILRDRHKAEGTWTAFMKEHELPEASVREAIAFADRADTKDETSLLACRTLTDARKLLGLADESGQRQARTQRAGPNAGNIKPMPKLKSAVKAFDAFIDAIGNKRRSEKYAAELNIDHVREIADKLREDLAKLDAFIASAPTPNVVKDAA